MKPLSKEDIYYVRDLFTEQLPTDKYAVIELSRFREFVNRLNEDLQNKLGNKGDKNYIIFSTIDNLCGEVLE